nr:MAG TPA: hypothetical protein [Caudoviricetes sp.]
MIIKQLVIYYRVLTVVFISRFVFDTVNKFRFYIM